jgi:hypothetical protein
MKHLRQLRPSPAMVVACIALAVALGGTSFAAIEALPRNSVGAKQLKRNAVTGAKIKANAVNGAKVSNNSLTGADVNEATLGTVPTAASAAPSGAAGGALAGTYPNPALADASVTSAKIAAGAVGVSKFGVIPAVRASRGGTPQTIPTGGTVKDVAFDNETFDTANLHSTTTNNHQVIAPVAGVYQITGNVRWEGNATGTRFVDITTSPGGRIASVWTSTASTFNTDQSISAAYALTAGQPVSLQVFQNSGVDLDLVKDGTDDPNLSMVWIGPSTAGVPGHPARAAGPTIP